MPVASDYHGDAGRRRKAARRKIEHKNHRSYRCLDCNTLRLVHRKELARAAMPRCVKCGGCLEETSVSIKRRLGVKKEEIGQELHDGLGIYEIKQYECRFCFKRFRSHAGLSLHVQDNHEDF